MRFLSAEANSLLLVPMLLVSFCTSRSPFKRPFPRNIEKITSNTKISPTEGPNPAPESGQKMQYGYLFTMRQSENLEKVLGWLVTRLKTCINENGLDVEKFSAMYSYFEQDLLEIETHINRHPPNRRLADQLHFAKFMFRVMENAFWPLRVHSISDFEHQVVWALKFANVRALLIFDAYGKPAVEKPDFFETRVWLTSLLENLEKASAKIGQKSFSMNPVYFEELQQTKATLRALQDLEE